MPAAHGPKWSDDAFLDTLARSSDPLADACARDLPRDQSLAFLFTKMRTDADIPAPAEMPAPFAAFVQAARPSLELDDLSAGDLARLKRGQQVFMLHALPAALVLLAKSLQEGYQAPRLSKVLMMSGELASSTYRRVLGVLQMLLQVSTPGSFDPVLKSDELPASDSALQAVKVRLMHAGLRGIAAEKFPTFGLQYGGTPISLEDMLATLMAFSHLLIEGLDTLGIHLDAGDAEDYHFTWRVYARQMGIHPPGQPKSWDWIPETLADARAFYDSYKRRHYREAPENEEGVLLAAANLRMLARRMPPLAARIFTLRLIGDDASRRLKIPAVPLLFVWKALLLNFPRVWVWAWRRLDRRASGVQRHDEITSTMLQRLIVIQYNAGIPSYRVPRDMDEVREVVTGTQPGFNFGREQFLSQVFPAELGDIAARRRALGLDADRLRDARPATDKALVGLALSGGGIRSATFALGVVQALARRGCLRMVDYLSTVSGGGYTGSMLSSVLNAPDAGVDGRAFPLDYETGQVEPPAIRHLRNGSNYLAAGGLLDEVRLPTIIFRGLLLNAVLALPFIILAAVLTFIAIPYVEQSGIIAAIVWLSLAAFLALLVSYPAVIWLYGRKRTWDQRDAAEKRQAIAALLLSTALVLAMAANVVGTAITGTWVGVKGGVTRDFSRPAELHDLWLWILIAVVIYAAIRAGKLASAVHQRVARLTLYVVGFLGPASIFAAYLLLLVLFARSPFLSHDNAERLETAARATPPVVRDSVLIQKLADHGIGADILGNYYRGSQLYVLNESPSADGSRRWHLVDSVLTVDTTVDGDTTRTLKVRTFRIVDHPGEDYLKIHGVEFGSPGFPEDWVLALFGLVVFALNALWVDVNVTSPHGFWRDRLSRVFLFKSRWFGRPAPNDGLKLSAMGTANPAVPYHIVNTALNLSGSRVEDLPGRRSDFFMFSRRYTGSYTTGYCTSEAMEAADPHIDLGTAMAISAAATAPNAGTVTVRPLIFMLTLLNIRLDYWAPNPWFVQASSLVRRLWARLARPGPGYLVREALGMLHARGAFVNLSDGGHIENLAVYELLRRRCEVIVCSDGEQDTDMTCPSLAKLIRYARIDLGIEIDIDLSPLHLNDPGRVTRSHWTLGTIKYGRGETGYLLYIKSSITGDEPPYVLDYRMRNPTFPQESTADQFFNEAQFESYRALGYHTMNGALKSVALLETGVGRSATTQVLAELRDRLGLRSDRLSSSMGAVS